MKSVFILLFSLPCFLHAGTGSERHSEAERTMRAGPSQAHAEPDSFLLMQRHITEEAQTSWSMESSETAVVEEATREQPVKTIRKVKPNKEHRMVWSRTGTVILVVSAGIFVLGLLFLFIGLGAFSYGLILLGELLLVLGSIGAIIGLIVGVLSM